MLVINANKGNQGYLTSSMSGIYDYDLDGNYYTMFFGGQGPYITKTNCSNCCNCDYCHYSLFQCATTSPCYARHNNNFCITCYNQNQSDWCGFKYDILDRDIIFPRNYEVDGGGTFSFPAVKNGGNWNFCNCNIYLTNYPYMSDLFSGQCTFCKFGPAFGRTIGVLSRKEFEGGECVGQKIKGYLNLFGEDFKHSCYATATKFCTLGICFWYKLGLRHTDGTCDFLINNCINFGSYNGVELCSCKLQIIKGILETNGLTARNGDRLFTELGYCDLGFCGCGTCGSNPGCPIYREICYGAQFGNNSQRSGILCSQTDENRALGLQISIK